MKSHSLLLILAVFTSLHLRGESPQKEKRLHIEKCSSGVEYPTKKETVAIDSGGKTYHVRILHPQVVKGPHFSTPFFWVSKQGRKDDFQWKSLISVTSDISGLTWNSINRGYFFAEQEVEEGKTLVGFLLEDGRDNADSGARGLLFVYDGETASAWRWEYHSARGGFRISDADDASKPAPASMLRRISQVLDLAEKEADFWSGP